VSLGDQVNSDIDEIDPFIAPDESYIIFLRRDRENSSNTDLFISFRKNDGSWTKAKNMGEPINSNALEICPSISPDGKYFFFTSYRSFHKSYSEVPLTYEKKIRILDSPGNGLGDIYWVDARIIEELRPKDFN
jgi:Tol biopolymer transport system component